MLQSVYVKNLALIKEIEVEFEDGLNILTGETGAGKTILLGSINLALGGRYSRDIIRKGADAAVVELVFHVENKRVLAKLQEMDIYPEDGTLIFSRRMMDGRSSCRINGRTATMGTLREAAGTLIDIHGQHEHQSLLDRKNYLGFVDAFSGASIQDAKESVASLYQTYRQCKAQLTQAGMDEAQRAKELSFLRFEAEEIRGADLKDGEDEELERQYRKMVNGKKIAEAARDVWRFTSGDGMSASENLSRAIRALSEIQDLDEDAGALYGQLTEVDSLLSDFNRELADYREDCEFSEADFTETENRLNEINRLKAKYGRTLDAVMQYCKEQEEKISRLEDYENYAAGLKRDYEKAREDLLSWCRKLSGKRKEQAKILEKAVTDGLKDLNFPDVRFEICFQESQDFTPDGLDDVEFMVSLNPGQPLRPLAHVASGGELSRIMLAIKTVMADRDETETLIFDEIDAGISGRTAQKVSEKMAVIGKRRQVICITHLAQIAAMADHHFLIEKKIENKETATGIRLLEEKESVQELARILGGAKITDAVLKNAVEMKELANQIKLD